jgi:hypothetical protein
MVALRVTGFSGVAPRRAARMLENNQAQVAMNCHLTSGEILPMKEPKLVINPAVAAVQSIFRVTDGAADYWLAWGADVDAVKGPIAGDTSFRIYFTGKNEPRVTNLLLAIASMPYPGSCFVLGVFPPSVAPGVVHDGLGGGAAVSRAFCYTFVTPWGEESAPSPASAVVNGLVSGLWTISGMSVAPANNFAVLGAAWVGGIATLNVASTVGLRVGEEIVVTGMTPAGYNAAAAVITAVAAGSVSYAVAANPGAFVAGGNIARAAPHNTAGMTKRIYWTETSASGTKYRFVKEVAVATAATTVAGNTVSSEELPSSDWPMPPAGLRGLCLHPSGAMFGFYENVVYATPPYIPYAWPVAYQVPVDYAVVGLKIVDTMVVIATKGNPYTLSGADPESMAPPAKVAQPWPCVSKKGMVNLGFGVAWPAPQGLALIGPGVADLVTRDLYTQEEWQLLDPSTFIGAQYAGRYVASYSVGGGQRQILIIDKSEFAAVVQANKNVQALWGDPTNGKLHVVVADVIYEWDADAGLKMLADWFSKEFVFPKPVNLGAAKVDAEFTTTAEASAAAQAASDVIQAANAALIAALATRGSMNRRTLNGISLNGSLVKKLPVVVWDDLTFSLYIDGQLKFSRTVTTTKAFRLPAGYKADNAAVRVSGNVKVKAILVAETMEGLATV